MTTTKELLTATILKKEALKLLPITSVFDCYGNGKCRLDLTYEADFYVEQLKKRFGEGDLNLIFHFVIRLHNIAKRDAEELFANE